MSSRVRLDCSTVCSEMTTRRLCLLKAPGQQGHKQRRRQPGPAEDEGEPMEGGVHPLVMMLGCCPGAGADPQDGHVLRSDGQPPAQRRQADAVRQPAGALRRHVLLLLPQPAALPLQLPVPGPSCPGQPLVGLSRFRGDGPAPLSLSLARRLFQMPHEAAAQTSVDLSQLNFTKHYYQTDKKTK